VSLRVYAPWQLDPLFSMHLLPINSYLSSIFFLWKKFLWKEKKRQKHTTVGIRWWSPTQLLIYRSEAYVWQSGRDAHFSSVYGRM
jgi:hypothetical protein